MKLQILNDVFFLDNDSGIATAVISTIQNVLENTSYVYSHLIVDGTEVFTDPCDYFKENDVYGMKEVVVIVQTREELCRDVIFSAYQYLQGSIPQVLTLSQTFYHGGDSGSWTSLNEFLEGLQWIVGSYVLLTQHRDSIRVFESSVWDGYSRAVEQLQQMIPELVESIENNDQVLLADLLTYEIVPLLEEMQLSLKQLVEGGGESHAH